MSGPLAGVRVVELAGLGPAPYAGGLLTDLGAEVLRIARPNDPTAGVDPLGRGRPLLTVDLKDPAGLARVLDLAERADVLVEGYRPGVVERLGLGPQACLDRNPRLVYARMTGWGQDGPLAPRAGHDINYIALTGVLHLSGEPDRPPRPPANLLGDFGGGALFLVVGILAALLERERSGRGQVVDTAMVDGAASLATMLFRHLALGMWRDERGTNSLDGAAPYYRSYPCADGRWVAVGALEGQFYAELVRVTGIEDVPDRDDRAQWPELQRRLAAAFAGRTRDEWAAAFDGVDACVTPVLSMTEAPRDPHMRARSTFVDDGSGPDPAPAPRFSRTPGERGPVPSAEDLLARWGVPGEAS